jgi:hypothetical protein
MNVRRTSQPESCEQEPLKSVLEWLDRNVGNLSQGDGHVHELVAEMLHELRGAAARDELHLAWSSHGLEREDVGPVIVLLSPRGAALASVARRKRA